MAGTLSVLGIVAGAAVLSVGLVTAGSAAVAGQRLASAADSAALAAADTASGAEIGVPCDRAAEVAATFGAAVSSCALDGLIATVSVTGTFLRWQTSATARAGPPP
ncbi:secretion/DNA translocation related TadE-like protein [Microbacterium halimionae]|uniref:Secretion/DNA translocation related TadE-like protein n=1 Tax=Microbacterium halimionae TaxID=1526413 RepID=A0A7W3JME9_9MICO|nr:Rv3654c family TadE-like protein [Microbacterium halimionae]MBA8815537.1 secretion/DNA translocation related TadE-like protein [Microbacterium halimionae]NII95584.1 secretion/DNA translocation related TadE-like protein [Microbacterium halimionae]